MLEEFTSQWSDLPNANSRKRVLHHLKKLPVLAQSRMMVLSYPHNPTTAIAPFPSSNQFFASSIIWCWFTTSPMLTWCLTMPLPLDSASRPRKTCLIEFFTLSKSYMGGFRIGYAIGNAQLIRALRQVKAAVDFNQYRGILNGAIVALTGPQIGLLLHVPAATGHPLVLCIAKACRLLPQLPLCTSAQLPEPWAQDSVTFALSWWRQPALPLHLVLIWQIRRRVSGLLYMLQLSEAG